MHSISSPSGAPASRILNARAGIVAGAFALVLAGGCSLGTGVTPTCNLDNTEPACDPPPSCDDGKGGLLATPECCLARANDEYNLVCTTENAAGKDYRLLCGQSGPGPVACCNSATSIYDGCVPK